MQLATNSFGDRESIRSVHAVPDQSMTERDTAMRGSCRRSQPVTEVLCRTAQSRFDPPGECSPVRLTQLR